MRNAIEIKQLAENESTDSATIHSVMTEAMAHKPQYQFDNSTAESIEHLVRHKNTSPETLQALQDQWVFPADAAPVDEGQHNIFGERSFLVSNIMKSPNVTSTMAQDYINKTYKRSGADNHSDAFNDALSHADHSQEYRDELFAKLSESPIGNHTLKGVTPQLVSDFLNALEDPESETTRDYAERGINSDAASNYGYRTLGNANHNQESAARAVSALLPRSEMNSNVDKSIQTLLGINDLDSESINSIFNHYKDNYGNISHAAIRHPNADPALVASHALSSDSRFREAALKSTRLPRETLSQILNGVTDGMNDGGETLRFIIQNPQLTPDDINGLMERGRMPPSQLKILAKHPNAPDSMVGSIIESQGAEAALSTLMTNPNVKPEQILSLLSDPAGTPARKRNFISENPNIDTNIIGELIQNPDLSLQAAKHPKATEDQITGAIESGSLSVDKLLSNRASFNKLSSFSEDVQSKIVEFTSSSTSSGMRSFIYKDKRFTPEIQKSMFDEDIQKADAGQLDRYTQSDIINAIEANGNPELLQKAMDSDAFSSIINFKNESYTSDMLETPASKLLEQYSTQDPRSNPDDKYALDEKADQLLGNPNLNQSQFEQLITQRANSGRLRDKIEQMSDTDAGDMLRRIQAGGASSSMIMASEKCPTDVWQSAFASLDSKDAYREIRNSSDFSKQFASNATPEQFQQLFQVDDGRGLLSIAQNRALSIENTEHRDALKTYFQSIADVPIDNSEIINSLSSLNRLFTSTDWNSPTAKEFGQEILDINQHVGVSFFTKRMNQLESRETALAEISAMYNSNMDKDEHFFDQLSSNLGQSYGLRASLAENKTLNDVIVNPETAPHILSSLMRNNLISQGTIDNFIAARPEMLAVSIDGTRNNSQMNHSLISSYLDGGEYTPESSDAVAKSYSVDRMGSSYRSYDTTWTPDEKAHVKGSTAKLITALSSSTDPVDSIASVIASRKTRNKTKGAVNFVISNLISNVNSSELLSDEQKHTIFAEAMEKMSRYDLPDMPAPFFTAATKGAIATNNSEAMFTLLSATKKPPRALENAIVTNLATQDGAEKLRVIDRLTSKDTNVSAANTSKIAKILHNGLGELRQIPVEARDEAHNQNIQNHNRAIGRFSTRMQRGDDQKAKDLGFNAVMKAYVDSDDPTNNGQLKDATTSLMQNKDHKLKDRLQLASFLPADAEIHTHDVPDDMLNDSSFIESAKGNWAERVLYNTAERLKGDSANVVAMRLKDSPDKDKYIRSFLQSGIKQGNLNADSINQLIAAAPIGTVDRLIESFLSNSSIGRYYFDQSNANLIAKSSIRHVMPHYLGNIRNHIDLMKGNSEFDSSGHEHALKSLIGVAKISNAINDNVPKESEGHEFADSAMSQVLDLQQDVHQHFIDKMISAPSEISDNDYSRYGSSYDKFVDGLLGNDSDISVRSLNSSNADKALSLISNMTQLESLGEDQGKSASSLGAHSEIEAAKNWAARANVNSEQWGQAVAKNKNILSGLPRKKNVDAELIKASNFQDFFTDDVQAAETALDILGDTLSKIPSDQLKDATDDISNKIMEFFGDKSPTDSMKSELNQYFAGILQNTPQDGMSSEDINKILRFTDNNVNHDSSKVPYYEDGIKNIIADRNLMGPEYTANVLKQQSDMGLSNERNRLLKNAQFTKETVKDVLDHLSSSDQNINMSRAYENIIGNSSLDQSLIGDIYSQAKERSPDAVRPSSSFVKKLLKNPSIPYELFSQIAKDSSTDFPEKAILLPNERFNPAFTNPTHGGKLFRSLPIGVHDKLKDTVDETKLVPEMDHSKQLERLNQVLGSLPAEGMKWVDFKRQFKQESNWPEVKAIFQAKQNKPVMPEDIAQALDTHSNPYHVTYSLWDSSLQTHRNGEYPNLVVQLNTGEKMQEQLSEDPKVWALFQHVQASANGTNGGEVGLHPVTPHIAGWARVDTGGGKNGWIIEEFQSDFGQKLKSQVERMISQNSSGMQLNGQPVTADELRSAYKTIAKTISNFQEAAVAGIKELAVKQGVENLYMHGLEARAELSGWGQNQDYPLYGQIQYQKYPKSQGWEEVDYSDFPVKSERFFQTIKNRGSSQCWKVPLKKKA